MSIEFSINPYHFGGKGGPTVPARTISPWIVLAILLFAGINAGAGEIAVAAYNVENLFDLHHDGSEYPDYIPGGAHGWNEEMLAAKLSGIARVLKDMDADIVGLQEIESAKALELLQAKLAGVGAPYAFAAMTKERKTAVHCALISRHPIRHVKEIWVDLKGARNILKVEVEVERAPLVVYVNHWKSKTGPESRRLPYAKALAADIAALDQDADYVLLGDFNSDYDEFETMVMEKRFNDTGGITGINHVLKTVTDGRLVDEKFLSSEKGRGHHYNLWLELPRNKRWSVNFYGKKNTPDAILVPAGLYDEKGIGYVDNSFHRFAPGYLFNHGGIYRWQRADRGKGRHLGKGYSDHLPVTAKLTTGPFRFLSGPDGGSGVAIEEKP